MRVLPLLKFLLLFSLSHQAISAETVTLQLRWHHQAQFIGYYTAKTKGFYNKVGLDVIIKAGGPGIVPWQEVVNGRADYAVENSNALTAFMYGEPITALAAIYQYSPSVFLTKQSSGIEKPQDLAGKRVMIFPGGQDPELMLLLRQQGLANYDLDLIATSTDLDDLINDEVDAFNAYMSNEPYTLEQLGIPYFLIKPSDYGIDFYSDILITHQQTITNKQAQTDQFISASLKGWEYALSHPEEALTLFKKDYQTNKSMGHLRFEMNMAHELIKPELIEIGHMNPKRWQHMVDILADANIIRTKRSLKDFLYKQQGSIDWDFWKPITYMTAGLMVILASISFYLLSLNWKLKREISTRRAAEKQLTHLATHDSLTGLANRSALTSHLDMFVKLAKRNNFTPIILYIDLDGFKAINDTLGHSAGDQALIRFAKKTQSLLRESDIFGRLGGDEFLILLENSTREGSHHLAHKILRNLETPMKFKNTDNKMSASIGIAIYKNHQETFDQFLTRADNAMYYVKNNGKAGIGIAAPFSPNNKNKNKTFV
ncbi:GGDEF domain-containing protein [Neptunomonas qingdaonensis]|uniref:Diguanylate cyclase (GGDEF) domain-containing protein n=1 Tax=Neptunomonas qingdaonensis TaxID=1045558 RepID=A0A1I2PX77_9GAMM|nr:GGDEF domain-containing protein [Neptunomonas qingdaonensis]SFG17991.1 diguanylate cyclase (GGDEF) domain-containing protein [Neptunomonas qingdaonensis]